MEMPMNDWVTMRISSTLSFYDWKKINIWTIYNFISSKVDFHFGRNKCTPAICALYVQTKPNHFACSIIPETMPVNKLWRALFAYVVRVISIKLRVAFLANEKLLRILVTVYQFKRNEDMMCTSYENELVP